MDEAGLFISDPSNEQIEPKNTLLRLTFIKETRVNLHRSLMIHLEFKHEINP
jgi:hypothetical protein